MSVLSDLLVGDDAYDADVSYDAEVGGLPGCSPSTLTLYDWLGPAQRRDDADHLVLLALCAMLGEPMWVVEQAVRATGGRVGWAAVMDPDTVPPEGLAWYEMTVGLDAARELTEPLRRERIKANPAFSRGTVAAITSAVQLELTGDREVTVYERSDADGYGDHPYRFHVDTYASQTPDPAAAEARARAAKPAPDVMTFRVASGVPWAVLAAQGLTWQDIEDAGLTWEDLETMTPLELAAAVA